MALINNLGQYIKLDKDGAFEIYVNKQARDQLKFSTPASVILQRYQEIITELRSEAHAEERYYNPIEYWAKVQAWENEYYHYSYQIEQGTYDVDGEYPLISQYYPDVKRSIPQIVARGFLGPQTNSASESYNSAKKYKNWGNTVDV